MPTGKQNLINKLNYKIMKIVKITYENGEEYSMKNIEPLVINDGDDAKEIYLKRMRYDKQFKKFELDILDNLDSDVVEDYAENNFDLIREDDVEDKDIADYSNEEILEEMKSRNLLGGKTIISDSFLTRFSRIMEKENQMLLDNILTEFETKLNI